MHLLLVLSILLLVVVGGYLALGILRRVRGQPRRGWQVVILAAPLVSLGFGVGALFHFSGRSCFVNAPRWDTGLAMALPLGMALIGFAALGLGLLRLLLMYRVVARRGMPAGRDLQRVVDALAERLHTPRPRVLLCAYDRPLAITCGLVRPTLLLSSWMIEHLDRHELESVFAHELGHVARRDYLIVWLATVLRDAFFYLPTSWAAYQQLQLEKEVVCDDLAVRGTNRPLALASALAKVWQEMLGGSRLSMAQPFAGVGPSIEDRIGRLLSMAEPTAAVPGSRAKGAGRSAVTSFVAFLVLKAPVAVLILAVMGCGPVAAGGSPF